MKLSVRIAGLCGSGTFLLSALPGFYQQVKPTDMTRISSEALSGMAIIENMLISLGCAIAAGVIGYIIGDILSNPRGGSKKRKKSAKTVALKPEPSVLTEVKELEIPADSPAASIQPALEEG